MRLNKIEEQIEILENDIKIHNRQVARRGHLSKTKSELMNEAYVILANLQLVSPQMKINKSSYEYKKLESLSVMIMKGR